jgi:hypothetical protein
MVFGLWIHAYIYFIYLLVRHLHTFTKSFTRNGIVVVGETLGEISSLLAFPESESNHSLTASLFVRHANGKIARAVTDGLNEVINRKVRVNDFDLGQSKERTFALAAFLKGKDN